MAQAAMRYKAKDGTIWVSEADADRRDHLLKKIWDAETVLKQPTVKNGEFVQQNASHVDNYKRLLIALAKEFAPHGVWDRDPDEIHPRSIAGRVLDDSCQPLALAWVRLMRMDRKFREWDQPYFAIKADDEVWSD